MVERRSVDESLPFESFFNFYVDKSNPTAKRTTDFVLTLFISLVVIIANSLHLLTIVRTPRLHTLHNLFLSTILVADLMLGVALVLYCVMIFQYDQTSTSDRWSTTALTVTCRMYTGLVITSSLATMCLLLCLSIKVFFFFTMPLKYTQIFSKERVLVAIGVSWVFAIAMGFIPQMYLSITIDSVEADCSFSRDLPLAYTVVLMMLFALNVVGTIVTGVFTVRVLISTPKYANERRMTQTVIPLQHQRQREHHNRRELHQHPPGHPPRHKVKEQHEEPGKDPVIHGAGTSTSQKEQQREPEQEQDLPHSSSVEIPNVDKHKRKKNKILNKEKEKDRKAKPVPKEFFMHVILCALFFFSWAPVVFVIATDHYGERDEAQHRFNVATTIASFGPGAIFIIYLILSPLFRWSFFQIVCVCRQCQVRRNHYRHRVHKYKHDHNRQLTINTRSDGTIVSTEEHQSSID